MLVTDAGVLWLPGCCYADHAKVSLSSVPSGEITSFEICHVWRHDNTEC